MGRRKNKNIEVMEWSDDEIVTEKDYLDYNNTDTLHNSKQNSIILNKVNSDNTKSCNTKSCNSIITNISVKNKQSTTRERKNLVNKPLNNLYKDLESRTNLPFKKQYNLEEKQINNYAFIYNYSNKIYNYMPIEDIEIFEEVELSDYDDDLNYE